MPWLIYPSAAIKPSTYQSPDWTNRLRQLEAKQRG
jgi:hypothetical protein